MKRLHQFFFLLSLLMVLSLATSAVGAAVPVEEETAPPPPAAISTGIDPGIPFEAQGGGVQSISGSQVTFAPGAGGEPCYTPGAPQTLCFQSDSYTNDYEYVYNNWLKFPPSWVVSNVYTVGTPACTTGNFGPFNWSFQTASHEVNIYHPRYQSMTDHCVATYCVDVTPAGIFNPAGVSWYFDGDGYGSMPHNPCSNDGYTPAGQNTCDEAVNPPASVPMCSLPPGIYLEPETIQTTGCKGTPQVHTFILSNSTGVDTTVDLNYFLLDFPGSFSGPDTVDVPNGGSVEFDVTLEPHSCLEDQTVLHAELRARDVHYGYTDSAWIEKRVTAEVRDWNRIADEVDNGRMDNVLGAYNGMVWDVTGYGANANVRSYNPGSDSWVTIGTPPPFGVNYARSGCQIGSKVYMYGDTGTSGFTGLWSYDMETTTWAQEAPSGTSPPYTGIWAPAWAADEVNGICYLTGGATAPGTGNLSSVFVYDAIANAWLAPLPDFTTVRDFHAAYTFRNQMGAPLLCVAGGNSASVGINSTQCFYFEGGFWNSENVDVAPLPSDVWGMGYASMGNNYLLMAGGVVGGSISSQTYAYHIPTDQWIDYGTFDSGAVYRTSMVLLDGIFHHIGGSIVSFNYTGLSDRLDEYPCPECVKPEIQVEPASIAQVQRTNDVRSRLSTVCNTGDEPLVYNILEGGGSPLANKGGTGEWFSGSAASILAPVNGGGMKPTSTSGYRWTPDDPSIQDLHILVYADDFIHTAPYTYLDQALQAMGLPYTAFYDGNYIDFTNALTLEGWDLVLVGADNNGVPTNTLDALNIYASGGGRLVFSDWYVWANPAHPLLSMLGFTFVQNDTTPPNPVNWWVPDHPLFNIPNSVPEFTPDDMGGYVYGQEVEPLPGFVALAGFTETPAPNMASMIIGNEGRTIFKGFLDFANNSDGDSDGIVDGVELWENIIHFYYDVPWLSVFPEGAVVNPGECASHDVNFDSTDIPANSHLYADLYYYSNDIFQPVITQPIQLHVLASGDIETDPDALSAELSPYDLLSGYFSISNEGDAPLHWRLVENFSAGPFAQELDEGQGEWIYQAVEGVFMESNRGLDLAYPSAYRWTPAGQPRGGGISILVYSDDPYHPAPNTYLDQAIRYLGLPYLAFYNGNWGGFMDALEYGGPWDVVLFGNDNYGPPEAVYSALNNYVAGGGRLIMHTWFTLTYPANPLWNTMGVTYAGSNYEPPLPVHWWLPDHPGFNYFETVPELTDLTDSRYGIYGQLVEPLPGYVALAGYTPNPSASQAALVARGSDGGTIYKAFLDGHNDADLDADAMPDGAELWVNLVRGILSIDFPDMSWFDIDGAHEGAIHPGGDVVLQYHIHPDGAPAGEYFGWLMILNTALNESIYLMPVDLLVKNILHLPLILR